jgi:hypothetical protein
MDTTDGPLMGSVLFDLQSNRKVKIVKDFLTFRRRKANMLVIKSLGEWVEVDVDWLETLNNAKSGPAQLLDLKVVVRHEQQCGTRSPLELSISPNRLLIPTSSGSLAHELSTPSRSQHPQDDALVMGLFPRLYSISIYHSLKQSPFSNLGAAFYHQHLIQLLNVAGENYSPFDVVGMGQDDMDHYWWLHYS